MIILRPGAAPIGVGQICAVVSAMLTGLTAVLIKQLTSRDDPDKIVFLTNIMLMPLSLVPALFVWKWPTLAMLPALLGMGVCAVLGHVALVRGYAITDASLAQTFEFSRLPFTVAHRLRRVRRDHRHLDLGRCADHFRVGRLHHAARSAAQATSILIAGGRKSEPHPDRSDGTPARVNVLPRCLTCAG